jgi:hypothetical protein
MHCDPWLSYVVDYVAVALPSHPSCSYVLKNFEELMEWHEAHVVAIQTLRNSK